MQLLLTVWKYIYLILIVFNFKGDFFFNFSKVSQLLQNSQFRWYWFNYFVVSPSVFHLKAFDNYQ